MDFRVSALADVHDHSLALNGWEQVYRQMTPGRFESKLVQATSAEFYFFRESTNRRVVQAGVSPAGFASIAVPLYAPLLGTFQGRKVDGYALMMLGSGEEFRFYTPEAMHYVGVSLPVETMTELVAVTVSEEAARLLKHNVLPFPAEAAAALQSRLVPFLDAAERDAETFAHPASIKRFQDEVLSVLFGLLEGATNSHRDLTHTTYSDIVRRCERIAQENTLEPVTVLDLCQELRCSRRTLQTSFQRVTNMTPVEYLRSLRLNAVHRLLRSTNAEELLIGDAAARLGFTHLSYFAREYRDLFGELPSQTLRKS
ncbi:helix-turn-helix domain-containing protein [Paraburkholderia sabiae]|jgi:AraC-like DNA-binding protein|uniref:Helix-turn-helix domain-containing protein n=1 Tax=Paraburkholderia sabiae TaxID=273251 RepID=A0ABU9Q7M9_9BURK|nr:helix-turn-helix domain-containing protein [Paraburkholderia sabiae]WJZ79081.1 helix-turn-helix domain-containing protein [Paraburkholderia sabiae]CAD6514173.1 HTH-type transcriptional activator RhaR [Paraburkholderia sabiae]CAG9204465.1 Ethanolamine operon regulatory protein [Paraburkholderia sabiae]